MRENLKLLVVDDEESIRSLFKDFLEPREGCRVLTAEDGVEGLRIMEREHIDCCFTDLSMPKMDGLELTGRIHANDNAIPVVVMTGYPDMTSAIETLKNGVVDYLIKPFGGKEILRTLERVLRERDLYVENVLLRKEISQGQKLLELNEQLKNKLGEVQHLNLILQELEQIRTTEGLYDALVKLAGKVTACHAAYLCVPGGQGAAPVVISSFQREIGAAAQGGMDLPDSILKEVIDDGMPLLMNGNNRDPGLLAVPLKVKGTVFAFLLSVRRNNKREFSEKDLYLMNFLAEKASFSIENLALYESIQDGLFSTLYAFVETLEARDPCTREHSTRVSTYSVAIARAMGVEQEAVETLRTAGTLHDIGKIGVPDDILLKPGSLTESEYEAIKAHPVVGSNIVGHFSMWEEEKEIIRHHHERWDGNGYPDRIGRTDIPLLARILSVADVYDALTSDRSYRKRLSGEGAVGIIREGAGGQLDPQVVEAFLDLIGNGSSDFGQLRTPELLGP